MSEGVVAFRCNSGPLTGFGHLMRSRELARMLATRGWSAVMYGPPLNQRRETDETLFLDWRPAPEALARADEPAAFIAFCEHSNAAHAIMDDYRVERDYQRRLHEAGVRFLHQFDASAPPEGFWADLLVNANPYETPDRYQTLLEAPKADLMLGPEFAVLRPEFIAAEKPAADRLARRVLLTFGGGDDRGLILKFAGALRGLMAIDVISGAGNPRNAENQAALAELDDANVALHINPPDVASLMRRADLAVMAGGTSTYEAAHCGVPMILLAISENQERPCMGWSDRTGAIYLGRHDAVSTEQARDTVAKLAENRERRADMAARNMTLVDGKGGDRLLDALLKGPGQ